MGRLFGTDGIRGIANCYPMNVTTAVTVGYAIGSYFRQALVDQNFILIGQDTRLSGDMIAQAVGAGICSSGVDVSLLGVIPTPAVAYLVAQSSAIAGIVISASHNPFEDNGIKLFNSNGYKLKESEELEIEEMILKNKPNSLNTIASERIGRLHRFDEPVKKYIHFLMDAVPKLSLDGFSVVLDCANGAAFQVAPEVFKRLGADVKTIYVSPNGININKQCGSQYPEELAQVVVAEQADLGLAFDGDGDRLIAVDENGKILTGDQIMAVCAKDLKAKGVLKNNIIVSTIMSNLGFHQAAKTLGLELFTTPVGDRYVMQELIAKNAILGGENSGHIIFRDKHTTGDGIMAALRLVNVMIASAKSLSELSKVMTLFPQKLINVNISSKPDLNSIPEISSIIQKVEKELGEKGRVLVRYSGTQLQCRVMVEGPNEELTQNFCIEIAAVIKKALA